MTNYKCLICKEKLRKHRVKKGVKMLPKNLLMWMLDYDTKEEVINHIKRAHPKIYKKEKK